ncbi:elongation factor Tu [Elysia marginata]|uniref:Elongation factor Tu n=1 Tax=Elysia marginata TaxID=1093978 RepID=A0AAV4HHN4_9GAST|nr:elongation factor Tu [Elysia marginata]
MATNPWVRKGSPVRWTFGVFRSSGFSRKGLILMKRGRLNLGCASMMLVVMFRLGKLALFYDAGNTPAGSDLDAHTNPSMRSIDSAQDATCVLPKLDPCDPQILPFDKREPQVNCSVETNWVYVKNGTFHIHQSAIDKHGKILCEYAPIVRGRGDYTAVHAPHIKPMLDGAPLLTDFFKAACISQSGHRYFNIHLGVAFNPELHKRSETTPLPSTAMGGYDVFMFGFDSVSRMSWLRNLPKTREYFIQELGGIELEGHNIVGDGTVQALLPLLAGQTEQDLPTARRDEAGSVEVDNFPWIWRDFQKAGYVTAWGEDMSHIGTFQMRLKGFKEQPVDHSMRTYFLSAEPMYHRFLDGCAGSEARHIRFFNYFRDMYQMYGPKRKFMFGFHSEFSHNDNSRLKRVRSLHSVRNFVFGHVMMIKVVVVVVVW